MLDVWVATVPADDVAAIVSLSVEGDRLPPNLCQKPNIPEVGAVEVKFFDESV